MHLFGLLCICILWYYGVWGQLWSMWEHHGCGVVKMGDSKTLTAADKKGSLLPILAPVLMSTVLWLSIYEINPLHGPIHLK